MNGIRLFLWIALIIVCLVLLLFVILYFLWIEPKIGNPLDTPDKIQTITAIIALVVGTAASVGSAVATLQVASLGLEVSKSQENRDNKIFVEGKVSIAIDIYSEILMSIGDIFASGISMIQKIPKIDINEIKDYSKKEIPIDLIMAMNNLADNLDKLSISIRALAKNDFANFCFQNYASNSSGKLKNIGKKLTGLGMPESEFVIEVTNLSGIVSIIDIASAKIRNGNFELIIKSRFFSDIADNVKFNLPYDNRTVRDFFFIGNLIFLSSGELKNSGDLYVASFGSAILHDLAFCIPTGDIIKKSLSERYSDLLKENDISLVEYEPNNIISSPFRKAIIDTEDIGDLYLLIGGKV